MDKLYGLDVTDYEQAVDIKDAFELTLTSPYIIASELYKLKYDTNKHDHRNVHIIINNVNTEKLLKLISCFNRLQNKHKHIKIDERLVVLEQEKWNTSIYLCLLRRYIKL